MTTYFDCLILENNCSKNEKNGSRPKPQIWKSLKAKTDEEKCNEIGLESRAWLLIWILKKTIPSTSAALLSFQRRRNWQTWNFDTKNQLLFEEFHLLQHLSRPSSVSPGICWRWLGMTYWRLGHWHCNLNIQIKFGIAFKLFSYQSMNTPFEVWGFPSKDGKIGFSRVRD